MKVLVTLAATAAILLTASTAAVAAPGSPDRDFGNDGTVRISPAQGQDSVVRDMIRTPSGSLLVAGGAGIDENGFLLQLLPDGSRDPEFGGGDGLVLTPSSLWAKLDFQGGKIVAFGRSGPDPVVARFNAEGSLDQTFGDQGTVLLDVRSRFGEDADQVLESPGPGIDSQGRIIAGTTVANCATARIEPDHGRHRCGNVVLFRLTADGEPDTGYGTDGALMLAAGWNSGGRPAALGLDRKDRVLVRTRDSVYYGSPQEARNDILQRFLPSGAYDREFGEDGVVDLRVWSGEAGVANRGRILEGPDRRISVATNFFRRVSESGRFLGKPRTGSVSDLADGRYLSMTDIEFDSRGRMIISGTANTSGKKRQLVVSRYNADGALDGTWSRDGVATKGLGDALTHKIMRQRRGIIEAASVPNEDGGVTVAATAIRGDRWLIELTGFTGGNGKARFCKGHRANVFGSPGDDVLEGGRDSVIVAGKGDDTVKAGSGAVVCLGPGDDDFRAGVSAGILPLVFGGPGDDRIHSGGRIIAGPGRDRIVADGASSVFAGPGDDKVIAAGSPDVNGGPGDDTLEARYGGRLNGGPGNDHLIGGDSAGELGDILDGGPGDDLLEGNGRPDRLFGRAGDDRLDGGTGPDLLVGGPGRDRVDPGPPIADRQIYAVDNRKARGRIWMDGNQWSAGTVQVWYRCSGWNHGTVRDSFHDASTFNEDLKFNRLGRARVDFNYWDGFGFDSDGWMKARKTDRRIFVNYWGREDFSYGEDGSFKCRTGTLKFSLHRIAAERDIIRP